VISSQKERERDREREGEGEKERKKKNRQEVLAKSFCRASRAYVRNGE